MDDSPGLFRPQQAGLLGSGESLVNRNVHVEADQEHALVLERILRRHVKNQATEDVVMDALSKTLVIDRAYRASLAFAMNQISLPC